VRIAYFSPLNPQPTGISDYSEELLPHLARHAELDLFVDGYQPSNPVIVERFEVFDSRCFPRLQRRRRYDVCLYHMGNDPSHQYICETMLHYPGITVLHDYVLHQFFWAITMGRGQPAAYVREMSYCYGWRGFELAHRAMRRCEDSSSNDYPLADRVIDSSFGLIVHSEYARTLIASSHPNVPVAKVDHHLSLDALGEAVPDRDRLRVSLGLEKGQLVVASFGRIAPSKRNDVALRAFARLLREFPQAVFLLVGETVPQYDVEGLIDELALGDRVKLIGHVGLKAFLHYMIVADVCVNLRYPTAGETSGSLIRAMGVGTPVVVSDVGAFSELPDECCIKVEVGGREEHLLAAHLLALARDPATRQRIGRNAQRHAQTHHRIEDSARGYVAFAEQCLEFAKGPELRPVRLSVR
jgi:glycosyltransferase involved in cell wall biosynthesis